MSTQSLQRWRTLIRRPAVAGLLQSLITGGTAVAGIVVLNAVIETSLLDGLRQNLQQTALATAALIDVDLHEKFVSEGRASAAEYASAVRPLRILTQTNSDIRYAYTAVIDGDTMRYVLDADLGTSVLEPDPGPPLPGERWVWRHALPMVEQSPSPTVWGIGIRAFAPIVNRNGHMIGYVGITMRAERFAAHLRSLHRAVLLGGAASLILALLSGAGVWRAQLQRNRALDQAVMASRAKSQFLANMSHEIRTPMNGVLGMLELLLATPLDAAQRHMATQSLQSGKSLLVILNDILDFSKIEAGKLHIDKQRFDVLQAMGAVVELLRPGATAKDVSLTLQIGAQVPRWVRGDAVRLRQILINLIGNAIKFTDLGEVRIVVDASPVGPPATGHRLLVVVSDTGIGMSQKTVSSLFQPFSQADNSMSRKYGGTGLGLSIVKQLLDLMDGEIKVASRPGGGTRFEVQINFDADGGTQGMANGQTSAHTTTTVPLLPAAVRTVLLAEDNPVNREVAKAMLTTLGIDCVTAANGAEAVQALDERTFDAVLMDCQMPVMDGYAATLVIRERERLAVGRGSTSRHTPIVALTASALAGDRERCLATGMDSFLAKPYSLEELRDCLARIAAG